MDAAMCVCVYVKCVWVHVCVWVRVCVHECIGMYVRASVKVCRSYWG